MSNTRKVFYGLSFSVLASAGSAASAENAVSERIYFVQQDGRHALVYTTSRTDYDDYRIWFHQRPGFNQDDYLKDFLYLFPQSGEWSEGERPGFVTLKLPRGNFASLEWVSLQERNRLVVDGDGAYHYRNWDGLAKTPEGRFGLWNSPDDFEQLAYTWVFPDNLEPVAYQSNRPGEWVVRNNAITFYGNDVNDLSFNISYRPASGSTYDKLKGLEDDGIKVAQEPSGVRLTLEETLLFPTGVAAISGSGKRLLDKLVFSLKQQPELDIVVAGHTDNVAIGKALAATYPTNWELASARSLNIIHYLISRGVDEQRLESRAYAYVRPVDSNATAAGRANNRRIEILLTDKAAEENTDQSLVAR